MLMENKDNVMNRCYYKSPSSISKTLVDEIILAIMKDNMGDLENIYTLTGVGTCIWELLDGKRSLEEIKEKIVEDYMVKPEKAEKDLINLIQDLEGKGFIRKKR